MEARTPNPMGIAEGVPPPRQGEEEADDDDVDDPEYVPSKPASVPGTVTSSAMTIFTSLPSNSPEPEEWEIEYGFRFRGGWKTAPWQGRVDESIPVERGRGKVWVCPIDGLEADSKYIVRIRALVRTTDAAGHEVVGWSDWSETSSVIATLIDAPEASDADTDASEAAADTPIWAFLQESVTEIKREVAARQAAGAVSGEAEDVDGGEGDETAESTDAESAQPNSTTDAPLAVAVAASEVGAAEVDPEVGPSASGEAAPGTDEI
jgi:hypothetical protein